MLYQSNAIKTLPKIIGIGFNYLKHNQEMGEGSLAPKAPVIFFKPWSSVTYLPKHVHLPSSKLHRVDHELELGVFISKEGRNIAKEDAFSHIGGYFIGIDFSDRSKQLIRQMSRTMPKLKDCLGNLPKDKTSSALFRN